jgi:hypothetical protein
MREAGPVGIPFVEVEERVPEDSEVDLCLRQS